MAKFAKTAPSDSLLGKLNEQRLNLMDLLGEDLYSIFESGTYKPKVQPFGVQSEFNVRNRSGSFHKKFGEKSYLDFDIKPETKEWNLGVSFDID